MSELWAVVSWWIIIQALGVAAWPLAFRLLRWLPDRGYLLAKPLGLLLVSYSLWLFASIGVLQNNVMGIGLAFALVVGLSQWVYWRGRNRLPSPSHSDFRLVDWLREHRWLVIAYELIFALAFIAWAVFRAHLPDAVSGDKIMDLALTSAISRSVTFPPCDPWLAGQNIAYYYFGYLMMSVFGKLSSTSIGVVHSLSSALWFALSATGIFGVVANLVLLSAHRAKRVSILFGLIGAIMLVLMGNLEAPLDGARVAGWGTPQFWTWLDIEDLNVPYVPPPPGQPIWPPRYTALGWWFRASRVIHDYNPTALTSWRAAILGKQADSEPATEDFIDEFPQFTFLLGDMHAYLVDMPFVLLCISLALNLYQAGVSREIESVWRGKQRTPLWLIYPLALGALSFVNTWDFPVYLFVVGAAFSLGRWQAHRFRIRDSLSDLLGLGIISVLMYWPYYSSSRPQGFGLWPDIFYGTRLPQFFVMFGPFIVIGLMFGIKLLLESIRSRRLRLFSFGLQAIGGGVGLIAVIAALATGLGIAMWQLSPTLRQWFNDLVAQMAARGISIGDHLLLRLSDPWVPLLLASGSVAILLLWRAHRSTSFEDERLDSMPTAFVLLLFFTGLLLTLAVESIYITGMEKTRANTGFKFYYEAWILWSVASAYGAYYLLKSQSHIASTWKRITVGTTIAGIIGLGLMYPLLAIPTRIDPKSNPTLDTVLATAQSERYYQNTYDAYLAVQWLNQNVSGTPIILEASDDAHQYKPARARISTWTGLPTLVGWYWHEVQWRGNDDIQRQRLPDITAIYSTTDPQVALSLLKKYNVSYIYVGHNERKQYPANGLAKFDRMLPIVFQHGEAKIYRIP